MLLLYGIVYHHCEAPCYYLLLITTYRECKRSRQVLCQLLMLRGFGERYWSRYAGLICLFWLWVRESMVQRVQVISSSIHGPGLCLLWITLLLVTQLGNGN